MKENYWTFSPPPQLEFEMRILYLEIIGVPIIRPLSKYMK